jgi:hypothetical protein
VAAGLAEAMAAAGRRIAVQVIAAMPISRVPEKV